MVRVCGSANASTDFHHGAERETTTQEFTLGPKRVGIMLRREYSVGKKRKQGVLPHRYACVLTGAGCTFWRLGDRSSKVYNRWRDERDGPAPVGAFRDLRSAADVLTASGIAHWSSPTDGGKVYRWPVPPAAAAAASTECEDEDEDEEEDEEADDDGKKKLSGQEQAVVARFVSDLLYSILHACGDAQAWVKVPWGVAAADTYTSYHGGELLGYVQTLHARCHTFVDYEEEEGYRPEWAEAGDEEYWPNECRGLKAGV